MTIDHTQFAVPASEFIKAFERCGIEYVTTVPDMLQIALHGALDAPGSKIRSINCSTEDQAVETAAGLYAGGKKVAIIVQNQGFFAAINSVRALGLDGRIPLFMVMGQFGREWSNLGQDPRTSRRLETSRTSSWPAKQPSRASARLRSSSATLWASTERPLPGPFSTLLKE